MKRKTNKNLLEAYANNILQSILDPKKSLRKEEKDELDTSDMPPVDDASDLDVFAAGDDEDDKEETAETIKGEAKKKMAKESDEDLETEDDDEDEDDVVKESDDEDEDDEVVKESDDEDEDDEVVKESDDEDDDDDVVKESDDEDEDDVVKSESKWMKRLRAEAKKIKKESDEDLETEDDDEDEDDMQNEDDTADQKNDKILNNAGDDDMVSEDDDEDEDDEVVKESDEDLEDPTAKTEAILSKIKSNLIRQINETAKKKSKVSSISGLLKNEAFSPELEKKTKVIFESAVNTKVNAIVKELKKNINDSFGLMKRNIAEQNLHFGKKITNAVVKDVTNKVDKYVNYVVEEWAKENKLAIERGIQNEISESFMKDLKGLFESHYIEMPKSKVNVLEVSAKNLAKLEKQLNEEIEKNIQLKSKLNTVQKTRIIEEKSRNLAETEREELVSLCESVDFTDPKEFAKKVEILKENYFDNGTSRKRSTLITETIADDGEEKKSVNRDGFKSDAINTYAAAIRRGSMR